MPEKELAGCIEQLETLLDRIESLADDGVRDDVRQIVQCLLDYHAEALARAVHIIGQLPARSENGHPAPLTQLANDELVSSLLLLHGLHPADMEARVHGALASVRPFLESHGGDVALVSLDEGIVRLRMTGNCHGCPSSTATLKSRIEQAIHEAAPDVTAIELVDDAPAVAPQADFVPLGQLVAR